MKRKSVEERLALTKFEVYSEPHIILQKKKCKVCKSKICISSCPAGLFTLDESGEITFTYEGCLECGTCRIVCSQNAIEWNYPHGGFGVQYKFG